MRTLKPFDYFEPVTVKEAVNLLFKFGKRAQILAGGIDLIPRMRQGKIQADYVINIQNIQDLAYIRKIGNRGLKFGAMSKLHDLELSRDIQETYPVLYKAIHQIASVQTKCMGTAVGNLCVATPASDVATALMSLDAELEIVGSESKRVEPIKNFYLGYLKTSLKKGEIVTGVSLPAPVAGSGTAYFNLVRTKADIAKVSVGIVLMMENGTCRDSRISLGAVAPTVFRAAKAEAALKGQKLNPDIIDKTAAIAAGETKPVTDVRSTDEYRKQVTQVLVRRALIKVLEQFKY